MDLQQEHPTFFITAALLGLMAPRVMGIPGRRLLHALAWCYSCKLEKTRSGTILCAIIRQTFWPKAKDLREVRKGIAELKATGMFDVLEIRGRTLVFAWSPEAFSCLSAPKEQGYASFPVERVRSFQSEYEFRLYELCALHGRKRMPTFHIPGIDPHGKVGLPWQAVRAQFRTASSVLSFVFEQKFLFGIVRRRATDEVVRVVVKLENSSSCWEPGSLFRFSLQDGEYVEVSRVVGGVHTAISRAELLHLARATKI